MTSLIAGEIIMGSFADHSTLKNTGKKLGNEHDRETEIKTKNI